MANPKPNPVSNPPAAAASAPTAAVPSPVIMQIIRNNRPRVLHFDIARNEQDTAKIKYFYPGTNLVTAKELEMLRKDPGFREFLKAPKGRLAALTIEATADSKKAEEAALLEAIPEMADMGLLESLSNSPVRAIKDAAIQRMQDFAKNRKKAENPDVPSANDEGGAVADVEVDSNTLVP